MITKLVLVAVLIGTITGYDDSSGMPPYGYTANMTKTEWGICACSGDWSFGTIFEIEDLGTFVCQDRGGLIKQRGQIDIWFPSYQLAKEHGVWTRWVEVYEPMTLPMGIWRSEFGFR